MAWRMFAPARIRADLPGERWADIQHRRGDARHFVIGLPFRFVGARQSVKSSCSWHPGADPQWNGLLAV